MLRLHLFFQSTWVLQQRFFLQIQIAIILCLRFVSFLLRSNPQAEFGSIQLQLCSFVAYVGRLEESGEALWQYLPQHSNHSGSIFGSKRSTYTAHIYNFFHRGLGGKALLRGMRPKIFISNFRSFRNRIRPSLFLKKKNLNFGQGLPPKEYEAKKEEVAAGIIQRLEKKLFPGLTSSITFKEVRLLLGFFP